MKEGFFLLFRAFIVKNFDEQPFLILDNFTFISLNGFPSAGLFNYLCNLSETTVAVFILCILKML